MSDPNVILGLIALIGAAWLVGRRTAQQGAPVTGDDRPEAGRGTDAVPGQQSGDWGIGVVLIFVAGLLLILFLNGLSI